MAHFITDILMCVTVEFIQKQIYKRTQIQNLTPTSKLSEHGSFSALNQLLHFLQLSLFNLLTVLTVTFLVFIILINHLNNTVGPLKYESKFLNNDVLFWKRVHYFNVASSVCTKGDIATKCQQSSEKQASVGGTLDDKLLVI